MRLSIPLILVLAAACATEPRTPNATVVVTGDNFPVTRQVGPRVTWINFQVPVTVTNHDRRDITYPACAYAIKLGEESDYEVYRPTCMLISNTVIPAGASVQLTLPVYAAIEGPGGPEWNLHEVNGLYRVEVGLMSTGHSGMIPMIPSNTFRLVEQP